MKAAELRIGNWILQKCNNTYRQIRWYDITNLSERDTNVTYEVEARDIQPIPLTTEILEQAGFEKLPHHHWQLPQMGLVGADEYIEYYGETLIGKPMKYLHEVQNRFYSHTGNELEINL